MSEQETSDPDSVAGSATVDTDSLYSVLADKRRRYTIHYLKQQDGPVDLGELAEQVAAWENGKSVEEITSQERKRVYVALYQSHLETLDDQGLVDYDADRGVVELSEEMRNVDLYLEVVPRNDVPWNLFYVGLSVVSALVIGLGWLEVRPFDLVPPLWLGALVVTAFAVSALVQTFLSPRMRFGDSGPPPDVELEG